MASKIKIQLSKTLDERVKQIIGRKCHIDSDFEKAFILGFTNGNTYNYLGLTIDPNYHESGYFVMGVAYFNTKPTDDEIQSDLQIVNDQLKSSDIPQEASFDLYLIYALDANANSGLTKYIFSLLNKCVPNDKLKISVIDDAKLFNHSAFSKLTIPIQLNLYTQKPMLGNGDMIDESFRKLNTSLFESDKGFHVRLCNSEFTTKSAHSKKVPTETLYDHLTPPKEALSLGDYMPQGMTKEENLMNIKKMADKWRNRYKERRGPFEFEIIPGESVNEETFNLDLQLFFFCHLNEPLTASLKKMAELVQSNLEMLRQAVVKRASTQLCPNEIYNCTFKPRQLGHIVQQVYVIPRSETLDYDRLESIRRELHRAYLAPMDWPMFRVSQRILNVNLQEDDQLKGFLTNVHSGLVDSSGIKGGSRSIIEGTYTYHHYMQNHFNDNGWGCAYRSLQTIISWFKHQGFIYSPDTRPYEPKTDNLQSLRIDLCSESRVPTHEEIQKILVDVGDKNSDFIGSKKWIGSQEVCYVLNHMYGIESKFIAVNSGGDLVAKARDLGAHFADQSTPVMIGGGVLAHTIIGTDFNEKNGDIRYLILDPHYTEEEDLDKITKKGWCGWKKNSFWDKSSFYNLCLPQRPIVI